MSEEKQVLIYKCVIRSIATLAITTLLKTGAESSVERLMKQISSFVSEISDEFKVGGSYPSKRTKCSEPIKYVDQKY